MEKDALKKHAEKNSYKAEYCKVCKVYMIWDKDENFFTCEDCNAETARKEELKEYEAYKEHNEAREDFDRNCM